MSDKVLTRDNNNLSRVTPCAQEGGFAAISQSVSSDINFAVNCKMSPALPSVPLEVSRLMENSLSENTRKAYSSDIHHFESWGGTIPATPTTIASYLAFHAGALSVATLGRRLATISKAHEGRNFPNPCGTEIVRRTFRGLRRLHGTEQKTAKPLLREDLLLVLNTMGDAPRDIRDRALLLLGFAGGFRRSELVGLNRNNLEFVRQGLIVTLARSKTDQEGAGRKIGIPFGHTRCCPVAAIEAWLALFELKAGPIFLPIDRHGHIRPIRLSGDAVSSIIRERLIAAGIDPKGFSGHSLRAGFATSAARAGVSWSKIRAQTGHTSDFMLARYIRQSELFVDNAAGTLL